MSDPQSLPTSNAEKSRDYRLTSVFLGGMGISSILSGATIFQNPDVKRSYAKGLGITGVLLGAASVVMALLNWRWSNQEAAISSPTNLPPQPLINDPAEKSSGGHVDRLRQKNLTEISR